MGAIAGIARSYTWLGLQRAREMTEGCSAYRRL